MKLAPGKQISLKEKADFLSGEWTRNTLDSIKARPAKSPENSVGIPHVHCDLDLSALQEDFDRIFPGSVCSRIKSNHTPTRTVKKIFKDEKFLEKTIKSLNLQSIWLTQHTRIQKDLATKWLWRSKYSCQHFTQFFSHKN